ncbi:MAG: hypothetical protein Q8O92_13275 [Candidatus Latescibacter sp.]|nr:hypothetical protein [Candidatus Latescibacter sp.]
MKKVSYHPARTAYERGPRLLFILFLAVAVWGCTAKENDREPSVSHAALGKSVSTITPHVLRTSGDPGPIRKEPSFMTGESDPFNKGSRIESSRKGKLTDFGIIKVPLPTPTPNIDVVADVINLKDLPKISVALFENYSWEFPSYPFDYENDIASLKSLYKLHSLDRVLTANLSEMDKMNSLTRYAFSFLEGGTLKANNAAAGPSAFLITENRRSKGIGGTSEVYAAFLCQLSLACGYNSRIVSMHTFDANGSLLTHDVCETYMKYLQKWVVFDAYNRAACYLRDNIPQSALDLHTVAAENRIREIYPVSPLSESTDIASLRDTVLPRFKYIYMWRMNDILSKSPRGGSIPWKTLYQTHLVWEDDLSPISEGGFDKIYKFSPGGVKYVTHKHTDFNWTLDNVNMTVERKKEGQMVLYFTSLTPNFDYFEVSADKKTIKAGNVFEPRSPNNLFIITPVSKMGIRGISSAVEFMQ